LTIKHLINSSSCEKGNRNQNYFIAQSYSRGTVVKLAAEAFWFCTFLQQNVFIFILKIDNNCLVEPAYGRKKKKKFNFLYFSFQLVGLSWMEKFNCMKSHAHTYTHTHVYAYICVFIPGFKFWNNQPNFKDIWINVVQFEYIPQAYSWIYHTE
jgi:hypothetical protein